MNVAIDEILESALRWGQLFLPLFLFLACYVVNLLFNNLCLDIPFIKESFNSYDTVDMLLPFNGF